jgi:tetratricopeptide (TPR) repeat protein
LLLRFSKILVFYLIFFLCQRKLAFSQVDTILSLPSDKQVLALWKAFNRGIEKRDTLVWPKLITAEKLFSEKGNKLLYRQVWLMEHIYNAGKNPEAMLNAADTAGRKGWKLTEAECWHYAGVYYFVQDKFIPAFEYMQKALNVFDQYAAEYPYTMRYADALAGSYYRFGEYREAIRHLKRTIQLPLYWHELIYFPSVYNTLALCYQQLMQYDSAALWYHKSYETAAAVKDSFYMALANGNLGYTYYLQQQYDKALPLVETDYSESMRAGETGSATNAALTLSAIYIKKGQPTVAEKYMALVKPLVYTSRNIVVLKNWYENLYQLYKAKNNQELSLLYADSLLAYKDSVAAMRDLKAFNQAVLRLETEKHMNEVNMLESRRRHQILLRNSLLAGLVLLGIIALLWVNRQLLKHNKEKELAEQQLRFAEQELKSYIQKLKEKSELLEELRIEIDKENSDIERIGHINSLLTAIILTEEDWKNFQQLFEKVYPGFFVRLREKMPDLSPADTRLLALIKLKLPPKDMASMLGVSYDAIKKARQRLRKKIDIPEEGGLEEVAGQI